MRSMLPIRFVGMPANHRTEPIQVLEGVVTFIEEAQRALRQSTSETDGLVPASQQSHRGLFDHQSRQAWPEQQVHHALPAESDLTAQEMASNGMGMDQQVFESTYEPVKSAASIAASMAAAFAAGVRAEPTELGNSDSLELS
eukprot:c13720_g1_i2.p2 GENE.c13720_g1_i2~~c13720_g1_i2.p2  ORF type:complete len:142 (+),score=34.58 c13720_g1_i2:648-1073(+)